MKSQPATQPVWHRILKIGSYAVSSFLFIVYLGYSAMKMLYMLENLAMIEPLIVEFEAVLFGVLMSLLVLALAKSIGNAIIWYRNKHKTKGQTNQNHYRRFMLCHLPLKLILVAWPLATIAVVGQASPVLLSVSLGGVLVLMMVKNILRYLSHEEFLQGTDIHPQQYQQQKYPRQRRLALKLVMLTLMLAGALLNPFMPLWFGETVTVSAFSLLNITLVVSVTLVAIGGIGLMYEEIFLHKDSVIFRGENSPAHTGSSLFHNPVFILLFRLMMAVGLLVLAGFETIVRFVLALVMTVLSALVGMFGKHLPTAGLDFADGWLGPNLFDALVLVVYVLLGKAYPTPQRLLITSKVAALCGKRSQKVTSDQLSKVTKTIQNPLFGHERKLRQNEDAKQPHRVPNKSSRLL